MTREKLDDLWARKMFIIKIIGGFDLIKKGVFYTKIFSGVYHSLALNDQGQLLAWGDNTHGQTGFEKGYARQAPYLIDIPGLNSEEFVTEGSCGLNHSIVLTNQGRVFVTGSNEKHQLGLEGIKECGVFTLLIFPELINQESIIKINAGYQHSAALSSGGRIFTWGSNLEGQLGIDLLTIKVTRPAVIELPLDANEWITDLSVGWDHILVLTSKHRVIGWGQNKYGQLGPRESKRPEFIKFKRLYQDEYPEKIFASFNQSMILMNTYRYFAFGNNEKYRLGSRRKPYSYSRIDSIEWHGDFHCVPRFRQSILQKLFSRQIHRKEYLTLVASNVNVTIGLTQLGLAYVWGETGAFRTLMKENLLKKFARLIKRILTSYTLNNRESFIKYKPEAIYLPHRLKNEKTIDIYCDKYSCFFLTDQGRIFAIDTNDGYVFEKEAKMVSPLGLGSKRPTWNRTTMGWLSESEKRKPPSSQRTEEDEA